VGLVNTQDGFALLWGGSACAGLQGRDRWGATHGDAAASKWPAGAGPEAEVQPSSTSSRARRKKMTEIEK
jgi:hypothetical protein